MLDKKKVLVICRTPAGRMYLGVLLHRIWYVPIFAEDANEADGLARKHAVSLLLLDGDTNGQDREAAVSLLKNEPSLKHLPLLVLISTENNDLCERLISEGCSSVIQKPIDLSLIYGILGRLTGDPRQTPRVPVRMRVYFEDQISDKSLVSANISEGGIYVRTYGPLPENTLLRLSFTLPLDTSKIKVTGEVVRNIPLGSQFDTEPGVGIRFVDISEEARDKIRDFVKMTLMTDLGWDLDQPAN